MFDSTGKAAIIHLTGTSKSFIDFKLCEEKQDKTICWLSPSEYILRIQIQNIQLNSNKYVLQNLIFYTYIKLMNMSEVISYYH